MPGLDQLKHLYGRQLALDKDDNLIIQGTKIGYGRDGAATSIDLAALVAANSSIPNAALDGVTDDSSALNTALTSIGSTRANLQIPGPLLVNANITIPSNVQLSFVGKGLIKPGVNKTITINGPISAGGWQIFDISNSGAVVTGNIQNPSMFAAWFGVVGDGTTDNAAAMNACAVLSLASGCIPIVLPAGSIKVNSTVNGVGSAGQQFQAPTWLGNETRLTVIDGSGTTGGVPIFNFRGSSGRITSGYMANFQLIGNSDSIGIQIQGLNGYQLRRVYFDTHAEALTLHNNDSGSFTEFVTAVGCNFRALCATALRYKVTSGNNSFHGSGLDGQCIGGMSGSAPTIQIDDGARAYQCPIYSTWFAPVASSLAPVFTGSLAAGATSATLNAVWPTYTGIYPVTLASGEISNMTFTKGAATATFSAITFPTTASGHTIPIIFINNGNLTNQPNSMDFFGALMFEPSFEIRLAISKPVLHVNSPIILSNSTTATGANILSGTLLRVKIASAHQDSSYSFIGAEQSYIIKPLSYPFKFSSNMLSTARIVNFQITAPNYERRYEVVMDRASLATLGPVPLGSGTSYHNSDSNLFNTQQTGGAALAFTGNADGSMNFVPATSPLTLNATPSAGATSGTLTGTNSPWARPTGTYTVLFSTGELRNASLTNGATSIDWSADLRGGLVSGSNTTAITVYQLPIGSTTFYVSETQTASGLHSGGHIQI